MTFCDRLATYANDGRRANAERQLIEELKGRIHLDDIGDDL